MNLSSNVRVGVSNVRVALHLLQPLDQRSTRAIAVVGLASGASLMLYYCSRRWAVTPRRKVATLQSSVRDLQGQISLDRKQMLKDKEAHVAEMQDVIAGHVEHLERVSGLVVAKERQIASLVRERDGLTPIKSSAPAGRNGTGDRWDLERLEGDLRAARAHSAKMESMAQDAMRREAELLEKVGELEALRGAAEREEEASLLLKQTLRREAELMARLGGEQAPPVQGVPEDLERAEARVKELLEVAREREEGIRDLRRSLERAREEEAAAREELSALKAERAAPAVGGGGRGLASPFQDATNVLLSHQQQRAAAASGKRGVLHERSSSFSSQASSSSGVVETYLSRRTDDPRAHLQFSWA